MNERLEQEIDRFLISKESTTYIPSGKFTTSFKDPRKIAKHFYNLALKDVRKAVENMDAPIEYNKMEADSFCYALSTVIDFIDNLTK